MSFVSTPAVLFGAGSVWRPFEENSSSNYFAPTRWLPEGDPAALARFFTTSRSTEAPKLDTPIA